jgi:hypothetical protein
MDDDALVSLPRLKRALEKYDSDKPYYVGERYGYGRSGEERYGAGHGKEGPPVCTPSHHTPDTTALRRRLFAFISY